jgi:hypothetical protein
MSQVVRRPAVGSPVPGLHAVPWPGESGRDAAGHERWAARASVKLSTSSLRNHDTVLAPHP